MKTSCGILITDCEKLLMCHVTLSRPDRWDIPKGELEENETPLTCALRELEEETSLLLSPDFENEIKDIEIFSYLPNKQLHLFLLVTNKHPNVTTLRCSSTFERYGKKYPEVDDYKYVLYNEIKNHASNKLFPVLEKALNLQGE